MGRGFDNHLHVVKHQEKLDTKASVGASWLENRVVGQDASSSGLSEQRRQKQLVPSCPLCTSSSNFLSFVLNKKAAHREKVC